MTMTPERLQAQTLRQFLDLRDELRALALQSATASHAFGKSRTKRHLFVLPFNAKAAFELRAGRTRLEDLLRRYRGAGGRDRRLTWIPTFLGPEAVQVNITCSEAYGSSRLSADRARALVCTHDPNFPFPENDKATYRVVKRTGYDYRAAAVLRDGGRRTLRPFSWMVVLQDPQTPTVINLPQNRPRKPRCDARRRRETPLFSIENKFWVFPEDSPHPF